MSRPVLVALKGFPGSGKSAIGRALSGRLGWPLIDKDDALDILVGQHPDAGRLAYEVMWQIGRRQLLQGFSVICDSPLSHSIGYQAVRRVAAEAQATLAVVECRCSDEALWRDRVQVRATGNLPPHRATPWHKLLDLRARVADQAAYPITNPLLIVDTARDLDDITQDILTWLATL
jgi:predicted kinase